MSTKPSPSRSTRHVWRCSTHWEHQFPKEAPRFTRRICVMLDSAARTLRYVLAYASTAARCMHHRIMACTKTATFIATRCRSPPSQAMTLVSSRRLTSTSGVLMEKHRNLCARITVDLHDRLEDLRVTRSRGLGYRVSTRELVEEALTRFLSARHSDIARFIVLKTATLDENGPNRPAADRDR